MPKGGKREGAGRPSGSLSKTTADIRALAQSFGAEAINRLAHLAMNAENETAQIAACKELLDRGYGRSVQSLQNLDEHGNPTNAPMRVVVEFLGDAATPRVAADKSEGRRLAGSVDLIG